MIYFIMVEHHHSFAHLLNKSYYSLEETKQEIEEYKKNREDYTKVEVKNMNFIIFGIDEETDILKIINKTNDFGSDLDYLVENTQDTIINKEIEELEKRLNYLKGN